MYCPVHGYCHQNIDVWQKNERSPSRWKQVGTLITRKCIIELGVFYIFQRYNFFPCSSKKSKRHLKSLKIGLSLFLAFSLSYMPALYTFNKFGPISGYFRYSIGLFHVANFFIYLVIDEDFRLRLKEMCSCVCTHWQ